MAASVLIWRAVERVELFGEGSAVVGAASDISKSDEIAMKTMRV